MSELWIWSAGECGAFSEEDEDNSEERFDSQVGFCSLEVKNDC